MQDSAGPRLGPQLLTVTGNNYADKGAKCGVDQHPSSEPLRDVFKSLRVAYKVVRKFMVASCLKSLEIRPKLPTLERDFRPPAPTNRGPHHVLFSN